MKKTNNVSLIKIGDLAMKTRILILAITFCSVQMFASEIIFTSNSSKPFQIVIDNYCYTSSNGMIAVNNLNSGTYKVQIASNPNIFGEFRSINYQTIRVNPYTRTFCEVNNYGGSHIAYVEALRSSANMYVTVNLHRPAIHKIVCSAPVRHQHKVVYSNKTNYSRNSSAHAVNSRPVSSSKNAHAKAQNSRSQSSVTYAPRSR